MAKQLTGTQSGGETNPLAIKTRQSAPGWQSDPQTAQGDGRFPSNGTRAGRGSFGVRGGKRGR